MGERSAEGVIRVCISIWQYPSSTSKMRPSSPKCSLSGTCLKGLRIYAYVLGDVCDVAK